MLLGFSLLLHLALTPLAGLLGFVQLWLNQPKANEEGPSEQLRELPIELFEDEAPEPPKPGALPEEDPVALIEQLTQVPVVGAGPAQQPKSPEPAKPPDVPKKSEPRPKVDDESAKAKEPVSHEDAGAPELAEEVAGPGATQSTPTQPTLPPVEATAPSKPVAEAASSDKPGSSAVDTPEVPIDSPVALAGKAAKVIEKQTSVGLVLYMDRIRSHPLGKRIASMLPRLPQWDEFFGESSVNPVQDFDRMFLLGPSFADSSGLVMAIEYNTSQDKIRAAVNGLVKKRGSWLAGSKIPTAFTYADRADRVVLFPAPKVVVVVPPHLREQAQQGVTGVPKAKGPEALVASTVNPARALRRFGLDLPASLQSAKLRLTPLESGKVLLELEAQDESAAKATETAALLTKQIDVLLSSLSSVFELAGRFGFSGLAAGADLPRVKFEADGKRIKAQQTLAPAHIAFILDRLERHLPSLRPTLPANPPVQAGEPRAPKNK